MDAAMLVRWFPQLQARLRDRKRLRKKRTRLLEADAVILSMAKSGRTWLNAMLSHYYHLTEGAPADRLLNADNFRRLGVNAPSVFFSHGREIEDRPHLADQVRGKPWIFLHRDPRDVAVSWYFHRRERKPSAGQGAFLVDRDLPDELNADLLFQPLWLPYVVEFMNGWRSRFERFDRVLFIRYEEMRDNPAAVLARVIGFMETRPVSAEAVGKAVEFASFENLRRLEQSGFFQGSRLGGGRPGEEGTWKVRRGKVGGFADHFSPAEIERIDRYVAEHLHPSFGYAPNNLRTAAGQSS
jgi:hypothetical protein